MAPISLPLPVIFCFAGQGSQYFGMAADLMAADQTFRHWMQRGDAILAQRHGFSVLAEIYDSGPPPGAAFDRMEASHPAIFLVQYAVTKLLQHHGLCPDMLLGVSLGEFTAQAVAGMMPFEASLCAVADQPALFRRTCPAGGMVAVLGPPELHRQRPLLAARSEVAGINADGHFILSALACDLPAIEDDLKACAVPFLRLPVPFAFHSRFIDAAKDDWCRTFAQHRRETPFWPVWSSCTGGAIGPATPDLAWRVVREGMNLRQTFGKLEQRGGAIYVDLSPSGTLATVFRQCLTKTSPSQLLSVLSPFGGNIGRLDKTIGLLRAARP